MAFVNRNIDVGAVHSSHKFPTYLPERAVSLCRRRLQMHRIAH